MIRPKLRSKNALPYGGSYELNLPEKGMVGLGTNFTMLMDKIVAWRKANGWPVGLGLEQEVEVEVCRKYSAECDETSDLVPPRQRTWSDVILGTRSLLSHKLAGSPLVSQAEANRRAAICVKCPNNIFYASPCGGRCAEIKDLVEVLVGGSGTPFDGALKACAICSCELIAAVWMSLNFQTEGLTPLQVSQFEQASRDYGCWKSFPMEDF